MRFNSKTLMVVAFIGAYFVFGKALVIWAAGVALGMLIPNEWVAKFRNSITPLDNPTTTR